MGEQQNMTEKTVLSCLKPCNQSLQLKNNTSLKAHFNKIKKLSQSKNHITSLKGLISKSNDSKSKAWFSLDFSKRPYIQTPLPSGWKATLRSNNHI